MNSNTETADSKNVKNTLFTIKNQISKLKDQVSHSLESSSDEKCGSMTLAESKENNSSLLNSMNLSFLNYLKKILVLIAVKVNGFDLGLRIGGREEMDGSSMAAAVDEGDEDVGNMAQNLIWSMVKDRFLIEVGFWR